MLSATKLPHLLHLMAFIVFEVKMVSAKLQFFFHIAKDWGEKGDFVNVCKKKVQRNSLITLFFIS